jgi:hypothetical protein
MTKSNLKKTNNIWQLSVIILYNVESDSKPKKKALKFNVLTLKKNNHFI